LSPIINRALVVGGGFAGMSAAIELRRRGVSVDLVEIDAGWRNYGAGISIGGATLRAFRSLGVLDRFLAEGYGCDGVELRAPDGRLIAELPTPRIAGASVPGSGAVMRPVLARILGDATRACGTNVRLGCSVSALKQDAEGVHRRQHRAVRPRDRGRRPPFEPARDGLPGGPEAALHRARRLACGAAAPLARGSDDALGRRTPESRAEPRLAGADVPVRQRGPREQRLRPATRVPAATARPARVFPRSDVARGDPGTAAASC
jgi:hypothetical protein